MAFTKAIVLSETDLRLLFVDDLVPMFVSDELRDGGYEVEDFEDWVESTFEYILESEGVEGAIIFIDGEAYEVYNGREFVRLLRDYYEVKNLSEVLREFLDDDDDDEDYDEGKRNRKLGGKRLIERRVKGKVKKLSEKFWKK